MGRGAPEPTRGLRPGPGALSPVTQLPVNLFKDVGPAMPLKEDRLVRERGGRGVHRAAAEPSPPAPRGSFLLQALRGAALGGGRRRPRSARPCWAVCGGVSSASQPHAPRLQNEATRAAPRVRGRCALGTRQHADAPAGGLL